MAADEFDCSIYYDTPVKTENQDNERMVDEKVEVQTRQQRDNNNTRHE